MARTSHTSFNFCDFSLPAAMLINLNLNLIIKDKWVEARGQKGREAQDLKAGVGFLERGQPAPPNQLKGLGNAVSSPAGSGVQSGPLKGFCAF